MILPIKSPKLFQLTCMGVVHNMNVATVGFSKGIVICFLFREIVNTLAVRKEPPSGSAPGTLSVYIDTFHCLAIGHCNLHATTGMWHV